ncbi:MAG: PRC-barrel domain-containing protein [Eubacteriales bacterium]|nr:MAG: hypothetical protein CVV03_12435 [Firmicutes bacterium HGW-Firmicutes-8]
MTGEQRTGLLKTQDLVGKPVISLQGEEVGSIVRIIADPVRGNVVGLTVSVKGWFKGDQGMEFESVKSFGDYAVTVQRCGQIVPLDNLPTVQKLAQDYSLYNMRIITPEGKLIGTIDDFYFDSKTGKIEKYILTGGVIKNLFQGRASIPAGSIEKIGTDAVIAVTNVLETIQKEETGLTDSIEHLKGDLENWKDDIGQWKDDFEKVWDKTLTKASELSKTVGENLKVAAQSGKGKGKELLTKTGGILSEKSIQLKKSYELWMDHLQAIKNKPEKPLSEKDLESLIGLKAGRTVTDDDGQVIVAENKKVTGEIIEASQQAGKFKELLISVATKDLEDQIKSVEKEAKKK